MGCSSGSSPQAMGLLAVTGLNGDDEAADRDRCTALVVKSMARRKLIIAGPGTGKTHTFREVLEAAGGNGLALTFINNLAGDLREKLDTVADTFTVHGFCKYLLHRMGAVGLTTDFLYYPPLRQILAKDLGFLGSEGTTDQELARCLHNLDDGRGMITELLGVADYYDAVGHTDCVYRVLRRLERDCGAIPVYSLVVVDEFQDFSRLEATFISLLAQCSPMLIAGDDDQSLYGFKHASPEHIRALAANSEYSQFELPYCSRCTSVIVDAVKDVVKRAKATDLLAGRLGRRFISYPPEKGEDSRKHPHIIYAQCSVENKRAPYMGRYVAARISEIAAEELRASKEGGYPAALVIGPMQFVRRIYQVVQGEFPNVVLKQSSGLEVSILDGYQYLLKDRDSRLGWRIVLHCTAHNETREIVRLALLDCGEIWEMIPSEYRAKYLRLAGLAGKVRNGGIVTDDEIIALESATEKSLATVKEELNRIVQNDSKAYAESPPSGDGSSPSVICTSFQGAKGLSASHVFIVGFNNGHFPRNPRAIKEQEVCSLLVGLSRTRSVCHIVSCERWGANTLEPSVFAQWIQNRYRPIQVNKKYWMQQET